jgi:hypothetical protein
MPYNITGMCEIGAHLGHGDAFSCHKQRRSSTSGTDVVWLTRLYSKPGGTTGYLLPAGEGSAF